MTLFRMEIAGFRFQVNALFESTAAYCRDYRTEEEPAFFIDVIRDDLIREQHLLNVEADEEGLKRRKFSDMFLERSVIQRKVAEILLERDILMLHGSTVAVDGQAYLFTASCGTGKSTHTRFWREVFGERAVMVNDDKPFLRIGADGVTAYGSPWTGKHGLGGNVVFPLNGICILKRGPVNSIRKMTPDEARDMLLHQSFQPEDGTGCVNGLVERMMELVPLWEMECTKDPRAAMIAFEAMKMG